MMHLKKLLFFFSLLFVSLKGFSQLPGWKFFIDGDGNSYFLDRNNRIYITSEIKRTSRPLSVKGLDYYIASIDELIKSHRSIEALRLTKTILAMKPVDQRIVTAQQRAVRIKQGMIRRHGSRFPGMNRRASPLIFHDDPKRTVLLNENMHYSLQTPGMLTLLKNTMRSRPSYNYQGILLGVSFTSSEESGASLFDCLAAIDAEQFGSSIKNMEIFEKSWRHRMYMTGGKRENVLKGERASLYRYSLKGKILYTGYEGFIINRQFGYVFKIIAPGGRGSVFDEKLKELALSIKISRLK